MTAAEMLYGALCERDPEAMAALRGAERAAPFDMYWTPNGRPLVNSAIGAAKWLGSRGYEWDGAEWRAPADGERAAKGGERP